MNKFIFFLDPILTKSFPPQIYPVTILKVITHSCGTIFSNILTLIHQMHIYWMEMLLISRKSVMNLRRKSWMLEELSCLLGVSLNWEFLSDPIKSVFK